MKRFRQFGCAEHVRDALEVVSHDGDADFGLSACQASQQQTRMPEDAVFDCSEGMLNCGSPQPHRCWGGTRIHAVQRVVIDGTRDHSPCRLGTGVRLGQALQSFTAAS
jgi:hypothetical protein